MAHYRDIHIVGDVWRYRIGDHHVAVRGPRGEHFDTTQSALLGIDPDELDRARWKGAWRPPITPVTIRLHILAQQQRLGEG